MQIKQCIQYIMTFIKIILYMYNDNLGKLRPPTKWFNLVIFLLRVIINYKLYIPYLAETPPEKQEK